MLRQLLRNARPRCINTTGSFKIYVIQDGKLKKFTVKVAGVVVDGKGWGSATGPGGASFAVTVE